VLQAQRYLDTLRCAFYCLQHDGGREGEARLRDGSAAKRGSGDPQSYAMQASEQPEALPRDARVAIGLLQSMGVDDWEPRVVNQLLEFTHRYVGEVLDDAQVYAQHASRRHIEREDVTVAMKLKGEGTFAKLPERQRVLLMAEELNRKKLPLIDESGGALRLPPPEQQLTAVNYQLLPKRAAGPAGVPARAAEPKQQRL